MAMKRWMGGVALILCGVVTVWAAENDTAAAKKTRDEALMVKVTVEWKNMPLGDCLKELVSKIDDAGKGKITFKGDTGVSMNTKQPMFSAKDKTVADVLDGLLGENLGYVVIS